MLMPDASCQRQGDGVTRCRHLIWVIRNQTRAIFFPFLLHIYSILIRIFECMIIIIIITMIINNIIISLLCHSRMLCLQNEGNILLLLAPCQFLIFIDRYIYMCADFLATYIKIYVKRILHAEWKPHRCRIWATCTWFFVKRNEPHETDGVIQRQRERERFWIFFLVINTSDRAYFRSCNNIPWNSLHRSMDLMFSNNCSPSYMKIHIATALISHIYIHFIRYDIYVVNNIINLSIFFLLRHRTYIYFSASLLQAHINFHFLCGYLSLALWCHCAKQFYEATALKICWENKHIIYIYRQQ